MVKKKNSEQENTDQPAQTETSENKDNNTSSQPGDQDNDEVSGEAGSGDNGTEGTEAGIKYTDKVISENKNVEEKLAEMQDKYLRLSAEFDNYRKRTLREKIELSKYAGEALLLRLLPVMDDFERAISHMTTASDCIAMKEGIDLIHTKFTDFLRQNGVSEIESMNCPFDVDLHDAVAKTTVEEENRKGKIVDVLQKGYYLQDKVIRHSKVVIGE